MSRELTQAELDAIMTKQDDNYSEAWESHLDPDYDEASRIIDAQLDKKGATKMASTQGNLPLETTPSTWTGPKWKVTGAQSTYISKPKCVHGPTHAIDHGNFQMYVGKKWDVEELTWKFDVAVNLTGNPTKKEHAIPFESLRKYEHLGSAEYEVVLDWPDYGVLELPLEFYEGLRDEIVKVGGRAIVFCVGGHGRTGTFFAAMLIADLGWSPKRAIAWVREHYCGEAIESKAQEQYIQRIGDQYLKKYKKYESK